MLVASHMTYGYESFSHLGISGARQRGCAMSLFTHSPRQLFLALIFSGAGKIAARTMLAVSSYKVESIAKRPRAIATIFTERNRFHRFRCVMVSRCPSHENVLRRRIIDVRLDREGKVEGQVAQLEE